MVMKEVNEDLQNFNFFEVLRIQKRNISHLLQLCIGNSPVIPFPELGPRIPYPPLGPDFFSDSEFIFESMNEKCQHGSAN